MFISTVVCLVPVVDCSEAVGVVEMTEVTMISCILYFLAVKSVLFGYKHLEITNSKSVNLIYNKILDSYWFCDVIGV